MTGELKGFTQAVTTVFQRENSLNDADMQMWSQYVNLAEMM